MSISLVSFVPASGSILTESQLVQFDIKSDTAFTKILVLFEYPGFTFKELAYGQDPAGGSADVFETNFNGSTRTTVTDPGFFHYQFKLLRGPAWPDSPKIYVFAFNTAGESLLASSTYVVLPPPVVSPFQPSPALPPVVGNLVDCDFDFYDQAYLLRVVERSYPGDYIFSIKVKPNGGYEIFQSASKVEERVSIAIARLYCCAFVMSASGGTKATGAVEFFRSSGAAGDAKYKAGTIVRASRSGRDFVTLADATFTGSALGPVTVAVEAIAVGYEYNLPGQVVTAGGETLVGEIDTIQKAVLDSGTPRADPIMQVRQVATTTGGQAACLDGLGADLGIVRGMGESDATYRLRIMTTPDSISPNAIERGANQILQGVGAAAVCLREVGTPKFPGFFYDAGESADSPQVPANNYAYDMDFSSRPADRFKLYLDALEFRGFFMIGIPTGLSASTRISIYNITNDKRAGGVGFTMYEETISCP